MKLQVAKSAGFCFGVQRAVEMVYRLLEEEKRPIETLFTYTFQFRFYCL